MIVAVVVLFTAGFGAVVVVLVLIGVAVVAVVVLVLGRMAIVAVVVLVLAFVAVVAVMMLVFAGVAVIAMVMIVEGLVVVRCACRRGRSGVGEEATGEDRRDDGRRGEKTERILHCCSFEDETGSAG